MKLPNWRGTGEWTTRRYLSLFANIVIWTIVAIDAWFLWPVQLGGATSMVIVSGVSMEPTYYGGDLVIARKMEPTIGDVIVYAPASLGGSQVVHRITGGDAETGWILQGDNNSYEDPFRPKGDEVRGVVLVHYSNFGRVTMLLLNPIVWAVLLLSSLVLLLWWGDDCEDDGKGNGKKDAESCEPDDDEPASEVEPVGDPPRQFEPDGEAVVPARAEPA